MVLEWLDFLLNFNFTVIYKKGINHVLLDYLSRLYEDPETDKAADVKEGEVLFSVANWKLMSLHLRELVNLLKSF